MILFEENKLLERKIEILLTKLLSYTHEDRVKSKGAKQNTGKDLKHSHNEDRKMLEEERKKRP